MDLLINYANLADGSLTINFRIIRGIDSNQQGEEWVLHALGHRDSRITLGNANGISVEDDHPLLWKFSDYNVNFISVVNAPSQTL